jgi:thymidylate synthase (FAD)
MRCSSILPCDTPQHFVVSFSLRALLHFLNICDLIWPHLQEWTSEIAEWYEKRPADLNRHSLQPGHEGR